MGGTGPTTIRDTSAVWGRVLSARFPGSWFQRDERRATSVALITNLPGLLYSRSRQVAAHRADKKKKKYGVREIRAMCVSAYAMQVQGCFLSQRGVPRTAGVGPAPALL